MNQLTKVTPPMKEMDWKWLVRSEADLRRDRYENKRTRAASGFDYYGRHHDNGSNIFAVNQGMYAYTAEPNTLHMGRSTSSTAIGTSETLYPVTCISGIVSSLLNINQGTVNTPSCVQVKFDAPPAGHDVVDTSGDCRGSGVRSLNMLRDIDPKYGDVATSNNEAVARAFEGLLRNGDFRYGTVNWSASGGASLSVTDGVMTVTDTTSSAVSQAFSSSLNLVDGVEYIIDGSVRSIGSGHVWVLVESGIGQYSNSIGNTSDEWVSFRGRFTFDGSSGDGVVRLREGNSDGAGHQVEFRNLSVRPASEQVVIDRHDVFGGEYYLEEVVPVGSVVVGSGHVYPGGRIQDTSESMSGIPTSESTRPVSYYAVFDGDTTSKGKGVDFWALSEEDKCKVVSDPDNNIYLLDDGRVVQWRVRQRTFNGLGNGNWHNINPEGVGSSTADLILNWDSSTRVRAQGGSDVPMEGSTGYYAASTLSQYNDKPELGLFTARYASNVVDYECYFHVWGSVRRLNQGAYHPSYNPLGCDAWGNDSNGDGKINQAISWNGARNTTMIRNPVSAQDCFRILRWNSDHSGLPAAYGWGLIGSSGSGRPDRRLCDAIYEGGDGGVNDNRLPSYDTSSKEYASKIFQDVVNYKYRGEEKVVNTYILSNREIYVSADRTNMDVAGNGRGPFRAGSLPVGCRVSAVAADNSWRCSGIVISNTTNTKVHFNEVVGTLPLGTSLGVYIIAEIATDTEVYSGGSLERVLKGPNSSVSGDILIREVAGTPQNILNISDLVAGWCGTWNFGTNYDGDLSNNLVLSRKSVESTSVSRAVTDNYGSSWTVESGIGIDSNVNMIYTGILTNPNRVCIVEYMTFAHQTTPDVVTTPYGTEGTGEVYALSDNNHNIGCLLAESMLHKVLRSNSQPNRQYLAGDGTITASLYTAPYTHGALQLAAPANSSPAIKMLWYQSVVRNQSNLNIAWNELKFQSYTTADFLDISMNATVNDTAGKKIHITSGELKGAYLHVASYSTRTWQSLFDEGTFFKKNGNIVGANDSVVAVGVCATHGGWGDNSKISMINLIGTYVNYNGDTCAYGTSKLSKSYGYAKVH